MRVIICGGRDFKSRVTVYTVLENLHEALGPFTEVIHGDCPTGADALADEWAQKRGVPVAKYPADWSQGRKAGPLRNQQMADSGAELCIAFPGGRGTADMVRRAKAAHMDVAEVGVRHGKKVTP